MITSSARLSLIHISIGWINTLKVRVGYGVTGNASVSPYQTGGAMVSQWANKPFGQGAVTTNTTGAKASVLPNKMLGWEKTASTNVGIDFGFLNSRITGSAEYYIAKTCLLYTSYHSCH